MSTPARATESKEAAIAQAVASRVVEEVQKILTEHENARIEQMENLNFNVSNMITALRDMEVMLTKTGSKAAPKASRATGGAKKEAKEKKAGGDPKATVVNARLYASYAMAYDEEFKKQYFDDDADVQEKIAGAKFKNKDGELLLKEQGRWLWDSHWTEPVKTEIRARFTAWKEDQERANAEPQLQEDAANGDAAAEGEATAEPEVETAEVEPEPAPAPKKPAPKAPAPKAAAPKAAAPAKAAVRAPAKAAKA